MRFTPMFQKDTGNHPVRVPKVMIAPQHICISEKTYLLCKVCSENSDKAEQRYRISTDRPTCRFLVYVNLPERQKLEHETSYK